MELFEKKLMATSTADLIEPFLQPGEMDINPMNLRLIVILIVSFMDFWDSEKLQCET